MLCREDLHYRGMQISRNALTHVPWQLMVSMLEVFTANSNDAVKTSASVTRLSSYLLQQTFSRNGRYRHLLFPELLPLNIGTADSPLPAGGWRSSKYIIIVLIESEGSGLRVLQEMKPGGRSRYYIIDATLIVWLGIDWDWGGIYLQRRRQKSKY